MERLRPNQRRHIQNLLSPVGLDAQFYHGVYYRHGVPQISKEKQEGIDARLACSQVIFRSCIDGLLNNGNVVVYRRKK